MQTRTQIHSIVFTVLLFALAAINLGQRSESSELLGRESRRRHPWPPLSLHALFSGDWARQFEEAFADHFAFRDHALVLADDITSLYGLRDTQIHTSQNRDLYNLGAPAGGEIVPVQNVTSPAPAPPEAPGQWVNQILIFRHQAFTLAGYSEPAGAYYAQTLNSLPAKLGSGVRVFSILVPTAIEFLDVEKYSKLSFRQSNGIRDIYKRLSGVRSIDAVAVMKEHASDYLYFRTDHHWTGLGAYYAYVAAADSLGFRPRPLTDYRREEVSGYFGTLYSMTRSPALLPDTVELFYPPVEHIMYRHTAAGVLTGPAVDPSYMLGANKYLAYIGGDTPLTEIKTSVQNGRRILILKDSYGNAFVPFLIPHYEEIYVVDPRYYQGSIRSLVKQKGVQDVLVLNNFVIIAGSYAMAYHILRISG